MSHVDEWFHDQLLRIQDRAPIRPDASAPRPGRLRRAEAAIQAMWVARGPVLVASCALLGGLALIGSEALHGPMRADQPFGLAAPPAVFRASSMPAVNGRAPKSSAQDRNNVVMSGIGTPR